MTPSSLIPWRRWRRSAWLGGVLTVATLALMYGPTVLEHARLARDPLIFNDDARHWLCPLLRQTDPGLFPRDRIVDFHAALTPIGHRGVYRAAAPWMDAAEFGKLLPYLLYVVAMAAMGACAWRLGGWPGCWSTLALALSSGLFLFQMTGGIARVWAFPLTALAAAALAADRPAWLAALTVFAALLYPPAAVPLGAALALALVVRPGRGGGRPSPAEWGRRVALLSVSAILVAAASQPLTNHDFGRRLTPADVSRYPELGPDGRYSPDDRFPYPNVLWGVADAVGRGFQGGDPAWVPPLKERVMAGSTYGRPSLPLILVVSLAGIVALAGIALRWRGDPAVRRLSLLVPAAGAAYLAAQIGAPYLYHPQRHVIHALPILAFLLFPHGVRAVAERAGWRRNVAAAPVAAALAWLALLGGRGGGWNGYTVDARPERALHAAVAALPRDALVAGWPRGVLDNVPFVARRSVLLDWESHEVLCTGYADEMRRRMAALTAAYYVTDPAARDRLRDEWGVTHLLLDRTHFGPEPPVYFEPFNRAVREAHAAWRGAREAGAWDRTDRAIVYRDDTHVMIDLRRSAP